MSKPSAAKSLEIITAYHDHIEAIYDRCVEAQPDFGLTFDDFRIAIAAAVDKYMIGFGGEDRQYSDDELRQFISELQDQDLFLALACAHGNETAWIQFDQRYRSFIQRLTRHLLSTRADADDVIDHIYAELFGTRVVGGVRLSKFRTYTGRGTLQGWLRAVVSHAVIDFYRRRQDEVSLDKFDETGEDVRLRGPQLAEAQRTDESMLANVVRERYRAVTVAALDQALATLDDHEKLLLLYYHVENLKLREIARIVEEPRSPIRRWFQRRGGARKSGRVHESTVMRWLEKAYQKVSNHFHAELGTKHGLKPAEIEICVSIATQDLGQGVNLSAMKSADPNFKNVEAVEGAS